MKYPGDDAPDGELKQFFTQTPEEVAEAYGMTVEKLKLRAWDYYSRKFDSEYVSAARFNHSWRVWEDGGWVPIFIEDDLTGRYPLTKAQQALKIPPLTA